MNILIVEDDEALSSGLVQILERKGHDVEVFPEGEPALDRVGAADMLISDIRLPGMDGLELLRKVREKQPHLGVVMMTGYGTIPSAIEATRRGARGYLTKPFEIDELLAHVRDVEELVELRKAAMRSGRGELVGSSDPMQEVYREIDVAASSDVPVLITGETGTGKELAARAIHEQSYRSGEPFIAVNLGAFPAELIDSELFGHVKGAFTGAQSDKKGRFSLADGGSLFLDEADTLPLELQPKLLRAIESREIWPLGAQQSQPYDARIIAATNAKIDDLVERGEFREDLFYRLNVVRIHMPPLCDRPEDIPQLARALLDRAGSRVRPVGANVRISAEALSSLLTRDWPGNVRQLSNELERALARALTYRDVEGGEAQQVLLEKEHFGMTEESLPDLPYKEAKKRAADEWSTRTIRAALAVTDGNVSEAARRLEMSRTALIRLLNRYDVDR